MGGMRLVLIERSHRLFKLCFSHIVHPDNARCRGRAARISIINSDLYAPGVKIMNRPLGALILVSLLFLLTYAGYQLFKHYQKKEGNRRMARWLAVVVAARSLFHKPANFAAFQAVEISIFSKLVICCP